jgi:hypothetical protein
VDASEVLPKIESVFMKVIPTVPFEDKFADEEYARKFGKKERMRSHCSPLVIKDQTALMNPVNSLRSE